VSHLAFNRSGKAHGSVKIFVHQGIEEYYQRLYWRRNAWTWLGISLRFSGGRSAKHRQ
jgi:hypothetical protein